MCIVFVGGCGRIGFGGGGEPDAASVDADNDIDAATRFTGRFGVGTIIAELTIDGIEDDDPSLTGDLLELYFASARPGTLGGDDIFRATRAFADEEWSAAVRLAGINSVAAESTINVSSNGLWLIFGSQRDDPRGDVYIARRDTRGVDFGAPTRSSALNSALEDFASWISDDGLRVLIHRREVGRTDFDVLVATRVSVTNDFERPVLIEGLSTTSSEFSATLPFGDSLVLFGLEDGDGGLFVARSEPGEFVFGTHEALEGPNTAANEGDPWLSPDGCTLVFARSVEAVRQIFQATCE